MTYCLAATVAEGLVFASDSRTNAGVDQLSTYSKMFRFSTDGERVFVILTAGNLATTQAVMNQVRRDMQQGVAFNLNSVSEMEEAAEYLGRLSCAQQQKHSGASQGVDISASFILGGQIGDLDPQVFMVYPAGNFIAATAQSPFQQAGEVKYGKPILDRIIRPETSLDEAALCALVSMDSTMRSNATVGPPIELLIYERDRLRLDRHFILRADDPYLVGLKQAWDEKLKWAFSHLKRLNWRTAEGNTLQSD
jgi:putative proteasome-type protease